MVLKLVASTSRPKLGLQYNMKATYASVIVSAVTSLDGSARSLGVNGIVLFLAGVTVFIRGDSELLGCRVCVCHSFDGCLE